MIEYVPAEPWHLYAAGFDEAEAARLLEKPETLVGWTQMTDGRVTGVGCVAHVESFVAAAVVGRVEPLHHRMAVELLRLLDDEGVECVFAVPDVTIPGADKWMRRLGFVPGGEASQELCRRAGFGEPSGDCGVWVRVRALWQRQ